LPQNEIMMTKKNRTQITELMRTAIHSNYLLLLFLIFGSIADNVYSQQLVPLSPRAEATQNRLNGNLVMTGNGIVGLVRDENGVTYDPNAAYTGNLNNGNSITDYINIDGDASTFSSSSADIDTPRPDCTEIVYAGLYWTATYYLDRIPRNSVRFNVNNTSIAGEYDAGEITFDPSGASALPLAPGITGNLVLVDDDDGSTNGCDGPFQNANEVNGNIAVVTRGECFWQDKVINAQNAGAIAVVMINTLGSEQAFSATRNNNSINIPLVVIGEDDGDDIRNQMNSNTVNITVALEQDLATGDEQRLNLPSQDARKVGDADFRNVKFKVPGGTYVPITADDIIYDGYANTPTNQARDVNDLDGDGDTNEFIANDDVPYVCYKNVTSLIDQNNTNGTYTVADMNATIGQTSGRSGATRNRLTCVLVLLL